MAPLHYLIFNVIRGTGNCAEQEKTPGVFLFLVKTKFFCWNSEKNGKGLAGEFLSYIVVYPSLGNSLIKKYAADNYHDPTSLFLTSIKLDTSDVFTRIITKIFL